jgi:hypothetical protein
LGEKRYKMGLWFFKGTLSVCLHHGVYAVFLKSGTRNSSLNE